MTGFHGQDETGRVLANINPENLRAMLDHAREFVIVDNPAWGPDYFVQAARDAHGSWRVEVRSGGPNRHVGTDVRDTAAAYAIFRSWMLADGWWQGAYAWEPVRT